MKANKPETVSFRWRKLCPDIVNDFTGFETIKESMNDIVDKAKKLCGGRRGSQAIDLGETEELIDITPDEWTEDDLMEMSSSKPVPDAEEEDREEAVQETHGP